MEENGIDYEERNGEEAQLTEILTKAESRVRGRYEVLGEGGGYKRITRQGARDDTNKPDDDGAYIWEYTTSSEMTIGSVAEELMKGGTDKTARDSESDGPDGNIQYHQEGTRKEHG